MDKNIIIALVKKASVIPQIKEIEITQSKELLSGGVIDSLGLMSVITGLEDSLQCRIPNDQITITNFDSIDAIESLCVILTS